MSGNHLSDLLIHKEPAMVLLLIKPLHKYGHGELSLSALLLVSICLINSNIRVEQGKHQWDECKAQVDTYLDEFADLLASKEYLDEDVIEEVSN